MADEVADVLLQLRADRAERDARGYGDELGRLADAEREAERGAEDLNEELRRTEKQAARTERSVGQTTSTLRRSSRSARSSARLWDRMSRAMGGADQAASGLGGSIGRLVPGLADGAMVIGDMAGAAEAFAGFGGALLRILGPVGVAVGLGVVLWRSYADELERANEAADKQAQLATKAGEAARQRAERQEGAEERIRQANVRRGLADGTLSMEGLIRQEEAERKRADIEEANDQILFATKLRTGEVSPGSAAFRAADARFGGVLSGQLRTNGGDVDALADNLQARGITANQRIQQEIEDVVAAEVAAQRAENERQEADKAGKKADKAGVKAGEAADREALALLESFGFTPEEIEAGDLTQSTDLLTAARELQAVTTADGLGGGRSAVEEVDQRLRGVGIGQQSRLDALQVERAGLIATGTRGGLTEEQVTERLTAIEAAIRDEEEKSRQASQEEEEKSREAAREAAQEAKAQENAKVELARADRVNRADAGAGLLASLTGGDLVGAGVGLMDAAGNPFAGAAGAALGGLGALGEQGSEEVVDAIMSQTLNIVEGIGNLPEFAGLLIEGLIHGLPPAIRAAIEDLFQGGISDAGEAVELDFKFEDKVNAFLNDTFNTDIFKSEEEIYGPVYGDEAFSQRSSSRTTSSSRTARAAPRTFDVATLSDPGTARFLTGGEGGQSSRSAGGPPGGGRGPAAAGRGDITVVLQGDVYGDADVFADRVVRAVRQRMGGAGTASDLGAGVFSG